MGEAHDWIKGVIREIFSKRLIGQAPGLARFFNNYYLLLRHSLALWSRARANLIQIGGIFIHRGGVLQRITQVFGNDIGLTGFEAG